MLKKAKAVKETFVRGALTTAASVVFTLGVSALLPQGVFAGEPGGDEDGCEQRCENRLWMGNLVGACVSAPGTTIGCVLHGITCSSYSCVAD